MSLKTVGWIAAFVVVVAGGWYFFGGKGAPSYNAPSSRSENSAAETGAQALPGGTTNADLNAGLKTLDARLGASADASASAQGFNDTPVQQTE